MSEQRRALRRFPRQWFSTEEFVPQGGSEPREDGFSRPAHAANLLAGVRRALLSKPKDPLVPDEHIFFAARTWKGRPSLRRNLDRIQAKVHRVLPDGGIVASWGSRADYDDSKRYIGQYSSKQAVTADLDYIDSIKGLDYKDKLGKSLLEILERGDTSRTGLLELVFYPHYNAKEISVIIESIREELGPRGLVFQKLVAGVGRFTSTWQGPLALSEDIAKRVEAVALVEQAGELRPAARHRAASGGSGGKLSVVVAPHVPEIAVFDTGVHASHPLLAGVVLTGDPQVDLSDFDPEGGHGTFVAGVIAYGEDPERQVRADGRLHARAVVHSRRVELAGIPGGLNLDSYGAVAEAVSALRPRTKVFTASVSTAVPIDSDNVSPQALNIDLISRKYGVLFVLPTGNLPNVVGDQLSPDQPNFLDPATWHSDPNAQMGRPGEAFNAITVSSYAERQVGQEYSHPGHATVYSRRGPGPKQFPKPDLSEAGGNCVLSINPDDPTDVAIDVDDDDDAAIKSLKAPTGTAKDFGTSFAVPKVAFALARLVKLFESSAETRYAPLLAKAYLTHVCQCPETAGPFPADWTDQDKRDSRHLLYGHGVPDQAALDGVLPTEICFFATSEMRRRQRHVYTLKLPVNIVNALPEVRLRVTLTYFTKVDPTALDAELYSLVDLAPVVRWGGKTLAKTQRGGPLTDFYPLKSFEVKFSRPREGEPSARGQPTVEITMRDRVSDEDDFAQPYAIIISMISPTGELLINDLIQEVESE
ncbi:S8 family serine peptidase [Humisphaera borealis]|uniref:S8 family serine peptidase n=1 Tax=Humisphaera borealis TaxID=2807512 RepID=A0A7M2X2J9_9BACT|nr:S8 family serine peptidase [Humisphaera borealis]QOV91978.1 S8 family serine peptidase [Humisphaera borealis]